jgi:putative phosphoserine phosphatase/1-acylglycerol-3-phosphate O-acyltransferase
MSTGSEKLRGAFFDVDYTVLSNNSATLFVKYMRKEGKVGLKELAFTLYWVIRYKLNLVDFEEVAGREVAKMAGESEREMIELCDRWFSEMVVDYIYSDARALIEEHKSLGYPVVLLSYLCNRLEVDDEGSFTGGLIRPFSYGQGKIVLAEKFAASHGLDLSNSLYYSDSITDLPVLEHFGEPRVVNPDPLLRKEAKRRGWPVLEFKV